MEIYKLSDFEKGSKELRQSRRRSDSGEDDGRYNGRYNRNGDKYSNGCSDDDYDDGGSNANGWHIDERSNFGGDCDDYDNEYGVDNRIDGELRVTDLRQGQKNQNRINVFINGKYNFSLDIAQVVELGIKVGRILTEDELAKCKEASEFGKVYQRALEWSLMRPRSVRELRDYLTRRAWHSEVERKKKEWQQEREVAEIIANGEDVDARKVEKKIERRRSRSEREQKYDFTDLIVDRLTSKGYVDDFSFAKYYVENRFIKKGISRKRLEMELVKKGIGREIIEKVIDARNEEEELKKMIAKKYDKYDEDKLIQYLCRQGFDYQLVQNLVQDYGKD